MPHHRGIDYYIILLLGHTHAIWSFLGRHALLRLSCQSWLPAIDSLTIGPLRDLVNMELTNQELASALLRDIHINNVSTTFITPPGTLRLIPEGCGPSGCCGLSTIKRWTRNMSVMMVNLSSAVNPSSRFPYFIFRLCVALDNGH